MDRRATRGRPGITNEFQKKEGKVERDKNATKSGTGGWFGRTRGTLGSGGWGIGGAVLASVCCAPPAIAFALGLGGSAFLVGLSQYRLYFVLIGLVLVAAAGWRILRPGGGCAVLPLRARLSRFALVLAVFGGGYAAINYLLLPWLYTVG